LDSVDGVKDYIVEEQDLVEPNAVFVDGLEGAVADFGEECDALEALFAVGEGGMGQCVEVEVLVDDGGVGCSMLACAKTLLQ
jgi:hypothetical protein